MPHGWYLHIIAALAGAALACSAAAKLPGQTLTNDVAVLQKDVLSDMSVGERALGCRKWRVTSTRISKPPKTLGIEKGTGLAWAQWEERWIVDRCGKKVTYTIRFDMRGAAGTMFEFQLPK